MANIDTPLLSSSSSQSPHVRKGFPFHIISHNRNEIDPSFICASCSELLRDPVQTCCGHRFCKICFCRLIAGQTVHVLCPQCEREGVDDESATIEPDSFPDKAIARVMGKISVFCENEGCKWKGLFFNYPPHEEKCQFSLVNCTSEGCKLQVPR